MPVNPANEERQELGANARVMAGAGLGPAGLPDAGCRA